MSPGLARSGEAKVLLLPSLRLLGSFCHLLKTVLNTKKKSHLVQKISIAGCDYVYIKPNVI